MPFSPHIITVQQRKCSDLSDILFLHVALLNKLQSTEIVWWSKPKCWIKRKIMYSFPRNSFFII